MRSSVPYFFSRYGKTRMRRVMGARRCSLPDMPWFKCFTNKWWSAGLPGPVFVLTEAQSGFSPFGGACISRVSAIREAFRVLAKRPRANVLGSVALARKGYKLRLHGLY